MRTLGLSGLAAAVTLVCLGLVGCGSPGRRGSDGGAERDAGEGTRDSGEPEDGGMDSGPPEDAGPEDGGDAGTVDAGDGGADGGGCPMDCSAIETGPCAMAVCNDGTLPGSAGECVMVPMPDDTPCDDGDFCTLDDACTDGTCTGAPNDCGMVAPECREIVCDSAAEECRAEGSPDMNGMPCTLPDPCVTGTTCRDGLCTDGTREDCSSTPVPDACHEATCNPDTGMCEVEEASIDCSHLDDACTVGACDPSDGSCTTMPAAEGASCDDGDACTTGTTCTSGVCDGGTTPACSMTSDGCCPDTCDETNDADCACPGEMIGGLCVYLPSTSSVSDQASARSECTGIGTGWDLCSPSILCMADTLTYLQTSGCNCTGGASTCACGTSDNIYVHVDGTSSPYYTRGPGFPGCISTMMCTSSVSESCGVPLCCK